VMKSSWKPTYGFWRQNTKNPPLSHSQKASTEGGMFKFREKRKVEDSYRLVKVKTKEKSKQTFCCNFRTYFLFDITKGSTRLHCLTSVTPNKAYRGCIAGDGPDPDGQDSGELVDLVSVYCALAHKAPDASRTTAISSRRQIPFPEVLLLCYVDSS